MRSLLAATSLALAATPIQAAEIGRLGAPTANLSRTVSVPTDFELVFVSGTTAGSDGTPIPAGADTEAQTAIVLEKIKSYLAAERLGMGDIVSMRVYLVGVDAQEGRMDSAGMNRTYLRYFGTPEQPNKPTRATVQVAGLGGTALVEIEVQAARRKQ